MSENAVYVNADTLNKYITEIFTKLGMGESDASFSAEALVQANLWGIDSHGVLRIPIYVKRMRSGAINLKADIKPEKGSEGFEIMNGDDAHGFLVGRAAMNRAIELAKKYNVGVVGAKRSNHFGAAGLYARMATDQGMVGICMTNVVQNVVAPGGSKPVVGNNPLAIAIPTYGEFPFVLDISMSAVAGGKLLMASKKKEKIPLDWATDKQGKPTDDPDEAFNGFLLPTGGHKGYGLALVIDILCGVITGGAFMDKMKGMYKYPNESSLTGHFMIAVNISSVMGEAEMKERMGTFYQVLKASPMWDSSKEMLLPGELEYRTAKEREKNGIPLPIALYDELKELADGLGVSCEL